MVVTGAPYVVVVVGELAAPIIHAERMWYPREETEDQYVYKRRCYYHSVARNGTAVRFGYQVRDLDYTFLLEYEASTSLHLYDPALPPDHGPIGAVLRASSNPSTPAVTVLPEPGAPGSLGDTRALKVHPLPVEAVSVKAFDVADGEYGTGHAIDISVRFGYGEFAGVKNPSGFTNVQGVAVVAYGTPRLRLPMEAGRFVAFVHSAWHGVAGIGACSRMLAVPLQLTTSPSPPLAAQSSPPATASSATGPPAASSTSTAPPSAS